MKLISKSLLLLAALSLCTTAIASEDWPMWRGDAARAGYMDNAVPSNLVLVWKYQPRHAPNPAFPSQPLQCYDMTFNPVIADGLLYFSSSADNKVYALDAATAQEKWTFYTDAPVRIAPAAGKHGLYVGSDDGLLYCLDKKTGSLKWKYRAGLEDDRIMGNDRMTSRWPVRGGPAVVGDIVYFGAGIWPSEIAYICALDAQSGKVLWKNDDSVRRAKPRELGQDAAHTSPTAQGHLAVGSGIVLVPTGRTAPAAFRVEDGAFKYFNVGFKAGGTRVAVLGPLIVFGMNWPRISGAWGFVDSGETGGWGPSTVSVNHPNMFVTTRGGELVGYQKGVTETEKKDREGKTIKHRTLPQEFAWRCKAPFEVLEIIAAGNTLILGGTNAIALLDITTSKVVAQVNVGEKVLSLALAGKHVYASTPSGTIYCFGAEGQGRVVAQSTAVEASKGGFYADAAEKILKQSGISEGYCLDIGCGEGELAYELALRSKLHIYGVDTDAKKVEKARAKLDKLGLYGVRVTIQLVSNLSDLPYNGKFAELIVSSKALKEGIAAVDSKTVEKMICPHIGVACIGKPGDLKIAKGNPIPNSANWTHFFADANGSHCGTDTAVHGPLEMLWYRDTDYEMANRHSMSSPTMVYNGYMVMPGTHGVRVANVYNGRPVWQYDMPGFNLLIGGFSYEKRLLTGNMCVADGKVYARHQDTCRSFDIATGKLLGEWKAPNIEGLNGKVLWGYIACSDGVLYGSIANTNLAVRGYTGPISVLSERTDVHSKNWLAMHVKWPNSNHHYPDSKALFAMDAATGKIKWIYKAENSIRGAGISVGKGMIYFVDKPTSPYDDYSLFGVYETDKAKIKRLAEERAKARGNTVEQEMAAMRDPRGPLIALDSKTGKVVWKTDDKSGFGNAIAVSIENDVLVMCGGKSVAYQASTGKRLWEGGVGDRPMLYGKALRSGGNIYDLMTGKSTRNCPSVSGHCAPTLGSPRLLACRRGCIAYVDITTGGVGYYAGIRPGCYMDMTPAGGLLVMSDGSSGCQCSYINQCTIALQPKR